MTSPRGRCLIINNTFKGTSHERKGTEQDRDALIKLFGDLMFDVSVIEDCQVSFVCFVLSFIHFYFVFLEIF